jgi:hypothetical protein
MIGTMKVGVYHFEHKGKRIFLIDTPGFDDTNRSDSEVLKDVAFWLAAAYTKSTQLAGILYLHRISDVRMAGSALRNLRMFKQLCGSTNLNSVILATTHWKSVDEATGREREQELIATEEFWGGMVEKGSTVVRHDGTKQSALNIISSLVDKKIRITLEIAKQLIDQKRELSDTDAGQALQQELIAERKKFEAKLTELKMDMDEAMHDNDKKWMQRIEADKKMYDEKIKNTYSETEKLRIDIKRIAAEKEEQHRELLAQMKKEREHFDAQMASSTKAIKEAQEENARNRQEFAARQRSEREAHEAKLELLAANLREEHSEARRQELEDDRRERQEAYEKQRRADQLREDERVRRFEEEQRQAREREARLEAELLRESKKSESMVKSNLSLLLSHLHLSSFR